MKKAVIYSAIGTVIGLLLSSWLGPKTIVWYFQPPVGIGVDCSNAISWALNRMLTVQLIGGAIGLVVGIVLMLLLAKRQANPTNNPDLNN